MQENIQVSTEHLKSMSKSLKNLSLIMRNIDNELSHRIHALPLEGYVRIEVDSLWNAEHRRVMAMHDHAKKLIALLDKTAHEFEVADSKGTETVISSRDEMDRKELSSKTLKKLNSLHPSIRANTEAFLLEAKRQGINLIITDGFRSFAEQDVLYSKGRDDKGNKVTNARGGQSYHNYGLAFDVVEVVNGKADWNSKNWDRIGVLGKKYGFEWGGDFESIVDKPHFQCTYNLETSELLNLIKTGSADNNGFVEISK
ncbi:MAG: M15 family metallopeptidase [Candidatus Saccharibacteria bacterium]